jgi:hypothetical protein
MNLTQLETLLDTGRLQVWCGTAWYDARRNGKTKLWKRSPHRFAIPMKVGFKCAFTFTDADLKHGTTRERPAYRPDLTIKGNLDVQRGRVTA